MEGNRIGRVSTIECIKWLWRASCGARFRIVLSSVAGMIHVGASMVFVWVCKELIDAAVRGDGTSFLWYIAGMAGCMVMQVLTTAMETRVMSEADITLKNRLRHGIFCGLMGSRWDGKDSFHSGDALNRVMEDVRVISEAITRAVPAVIISGIQFIAAFVFLFILNRELAWVVPGLLLAMLLISRSYIRRMRKLTRDIRTTESNMQSLMQESLQHRVVIHTLEKTPYITGNLAGYQDDLMEQVMGKTDYSIFARSMVQVGFAAGYAAAFLWGVFGIRSGAVTFGMMTAFLQLVSQIQRPIMNLSRQFPTLVNSLTSAERLAEVAALPAEENGESIYLGPSVGIRLDNVTYCYPDTHQPVFSCFSHDFRPGTTTALVGETGVGKSTMMRLVLALLEPDDGKVFLYSGDDTSAAGQEGVPASPMTRCNIVYVPQGNTLMSGTIRDNLLLGDPSASDEKMREVLHLAVADFVLDLPDGLDTMCGERGTGLSEGQAQRIAIARSLLRKGGILLLDEPTASLDPQTEEILLKRLAGCLNGRTMILVTHRESAAGLCDDILRLQ